MKLFAPKPEGGQIPHENRPIMPSAQSHYLPNNQMCNRLIPPQHWPRQNLNVQDICPDRYQKVWHSSTLSN